MWPSAAAAAAACLQDQRPIAAFAAAAYLPTQVVSACSLSRAVASDDRFLQSAIGNPSNILVNL